MMYLGSKNKIAKEILAIILKNRKSNQWFVEPFSGGCNITDKVSNPRLANDLNHYVISMFEALLGGWKPPKALNYDEYHRIKKNKDEDKALTGFVGVNCAFGGKWFAPFAKERKDGRGNTRCMCGYNNVTKQIENLKGVVFKSGSYDELKIPPNSIIYCDPPYQKTSKENLYLEKFNSQKFFEWCQDMANQGHVVYISEYDAPFISVWEKEHISTLDNDSNSSTRIEKLFFVKPNISQKTKLLTKNDMYNYQKKALEFWKNKGKCGLFLDTSLGKTIITLSAIQHLKDEWLLSRAVIVSTKAIVENVYDREIKKWEHIDISYSICSGTPKQRDDAVNENTDVLIISAHNIKWLYTKYPNLNFNFLILDESTLFKNYVSERFKYIKKYLPQIQFSLLLSATPQPNSSEDLWSQIYILDSGKRLERNITAFRRKWGFVDYSGFKYLYPTASQWEINEQIKDICISMKKEDYLDLPPLNFETIQGHLTSKLKIMYKSLKNELFLELENGVEIETQKGIGAMQKLHQFSSGFIYDRIYEKVEIGKNKFKTVMIQDKFEKIHNIKLDILKDLISDEKQYVVVYHYKPELEFLKTLGGKTLNECSVDDWNDGKVDLLLLHSQGQAHGLNLQDNKNCDCLIWLTLTYNYELYYQMNSRLHRQGMIKPVTIKHITVGDIETDIATNLNNKKFNLDNFLKRIKQ